MKYQALGKYMSFAAAALALIGLTVFFSGVLERQHNPNMNPASTVEDGLREVVLRQNRWGHYVATGAINGSDVTFMVDTGATDVAVPERMALELGLPKGRDIMISTANGVARGWTTRLDSVRLGEIELYDVEATIAPGLGEEGALLGMSFLKRVELLQRGETLTLRQFM